MKKSNREGKRIKKSEKNISTKNISRIQNILLIIFIIIFIFSGIKLLSWYIRTGKSQEKYEELAKEVVQKTENIEENIIDFSKLKEINSDIVAWIKIDGTVINYPIVQSFDNKYYLDKNFYREKDSAGTLFLESKNKKDFSENNTVIYGHNIKRGTMFADLIKIYNGELGQDVNIEIYTPDKKMTFKVLSSYAIKSDDTYAVNTDIGKYEMEEFKRTIKQKSEKEFKGDADEVERVLTLSTCDKTGKKRIIVHAELFEELQLQ